MGESLCLWNGAQLSIIIVHRIFQARHKVLYMYMYIYSTCRTGIYKSLYGWTSRVLVLHYNNYYDEEKSFNVLYYNNVCVCVCYVVWMHGPMNKL